MSIQLGIFTFFRSSNILFGLLTHLKRHPPRRPLPPTPANTKLVSSAPASPAGTDFTSIPSASTILPLPSFATARLRIPLEAAEEHETSGGVAQVDNTNATTRRRVRHLSHTALSLILERGRPVTRRVLVTSSPLYQPMDGMERLGYQVSVFLRVPDLGALVFFPPLGMLNLNSPQATVWTAPSGIEIAIIITIIEKFPSTGLVPC